MIRLLRQYPLAPAICVGLTIIVASIIPGRSLPAVHWNYTDLAAHLLMYTVFSLSIVYGIEKQTASYRRKQFIYLHTVLIASIFGLAMEGLQYMGPNDRSFELLDILANIIGSFVGVAVYSLIH